MSIWVNNDQLLLRSAGPFIIIKVTICSNTKSSINYVGFGGSYYHKFNFYTPHGGGRRIICDRGELRRINKDPTNTEQDWNL